MNTAIIRLATLRIPQVDRGVRVIVTTAWDAERVRRDRAMVDYIEVLGCADVAPSGAVDWCPTGPWTRDMDPSVRAMLREEVSR